MNYIAHGGSDERPDCAREAFDCGKARQKELKHIDKLATRMRDSAILLGFDECVTPCLVPDIILTADSYVRVPDDIVEALEGKHIIEDPKLVASGIKSGFLRRATRDEPANYTLVDETWHRICAPPPGTERAIAILFYKKDHPEDSEPTDEKIVSRSLVNVYIQLTRNCSLGDASITRRWRVGYSPQRKSVTTSTSPPTKRCSSEYTLSHFPDLLTVRRKKTPVDRRRIKAGGRMTKAPGAHSVYGVPYRVEVSNLHLFCRNQLDFRGVASGRRRNLRRVEHPCP